MDAFGRRMSVSCSQLEAIMVIDFNNQDCMTKVAYNRATTLQSKLIVIFKVLSSL